MFRSSGSKARIAAGFLALLIIVGLIAYQTVVNRPAVFKIKDPTPDFQLENLDGQKVTRTDTDGKVRLVYFYYASCPDVCQPTTFFLSQIQELLVRKGGFGEKTSILSITIDPARDTREVLKEYSARFHADPQGWLFLRGDEAYTLDLARKFNITVIKDANGDFTHANAIMLLDKYGNIRQYYNANDPSLKKEKIVSDMLALAKQN